MMKQVQKLLSALLALVLLTGLLSGCQLSEYFGKDKGTAVDTAPGTESGTTGPVVPDDVDINYVMDYLNEDLTPYIKPGRYTGLTTDVTIYDVDDAYLEQQLATLLAEYAAPEQITDRVTEEGDILNVDFAGTMDGVAFSGGTAAGQTVQLTENSGYIPGFIDGLYGVMPGETITQPVVFPDPYTNNPDMSGKEAVFTITVNYIEGESVTPALDDAFVKEHFADSGCETVDDFYAYYRTYLESIREDAIKDKMNSALWNLVMEDTETIELPQKAVDAFYWNSRVTYEQYAEAYGLSYEEFLSEYGGTNDAELRDFAERYIKEDLTIYAIVKAENLQITDEEYRDGVAFYCDSYACTEEELLERYPEENIRSVLQWNKLMDFLREKNQVNVLPASDEE